MTDLTHDDGQGEREEKLLPHLQKDGIDLSEKEEKYGSPGLYGPGFGDIGCVCVLSSCEEHYLQFSVLYFVLRDKGVGGVKKLRHAFFQTRSF